MGLKLIFRPARVLVCLPTTPTSQLEPDKTQPLFTHLHHRNLTRQRALPGTQVSNLFCCGIHSDSQTQDVATENLTDDATPESVSPHPTWPAHTDLVLHRGRPLLTNQHPIVRAVITSAIENLWAAMLFNNAFPDVCSALSLIKDCLLTAANRLKPGSASILERLENDATYLLEITPLVSLIHSETIALTTLCSRAQGSP